MYASAGALYPIEVYVASADIPGLSAGLYHYYPLEHALRQLREADSRGALAAAARLALALGGSGGARVHRDPWRTAWK
jgi:SagB-type dehydrogenase family enzyme